MTIGEGIRKARMEKGWLQKDLAEKAGILEVSVCHYESGKVFPGALNLISIADALEISLDDLVGRKVKRGK